MPDYGVCWPLRLLINLSPALLMSSSFAPPSRPGVTFAPAVITSAVLGAACVVVVAAVAAPLLVYSLSLATFGLAHVLSELRYVDRRFGRSLGMSQVVAMGALLAGIVAARASGVFGLLDSTTAITAELGLVVALALSAA